MNFKEKLAIIIFLVATIICDAQTKVIFEYDTGGNQIERYVCVNCNGRIAQTDSIIVPQEIINQVLNTEEKYEFSYYPNPVLQELNIKWKRESSREVSKIEIYSMSGQYLNTYDCLDKTDTIVINFSNCPQGYYNLIVYFTNNERKTIKIVKQ